MTVTVFAAVVTGGTFIHIQASLLPVAPSPHLLSGHPAWSTYKTEAPPAHGDTRGAETSSVYCYFKNNN